jgi:hypothetical protein
VSIIDSPYVCPPLEDKRNVSPVSSSARYLFSESPTGHEIASPASDPNCSTKLAPDEHPLSLLEHPPGSIENMCQGPTAPAVKYVDIDDGRNADIPSLRRSLDPTSFGPALDISYGCCKTNAIDKPSCVIQSFCESPSMSSTVNWSPRPLSYGPPPELDSPHQRMTLATTLSLPLSNVSSRRWSIRKISAMMSADSLLVWL